jgi:tetratricopeptide (TPR) repeat protein
MDDHAEKRDMSAIDIRRIRKTAAVAVSCFAVAYAIILGNILESHVMMSPYWQKRDISSPVFDARKTFSLFFSNILTPGMRNLMADLMLIEVHEMWEQRRWYRIPEYLEAVTMLQPEWLEGWEMGSWHMAYNVTWHISDAPFLSPQKKQEEISQWLDRAFRMIKSGIILNSDTYELYFQTGWMYYHRLGDYDNAIKYFRQAQRLPDHIDNVERFIAYSYRKKGEPGKAMDILKALRADESYHHNDPVLINILDQNIERCRKEMQTR